MQNNEWSWHVPISRAEQIELWSGQAAPIEAMRKELLAILSHRDEA